MRQYFFGLGLALLAGQFACGSRCMVSSQCGQGEFCNFETGDCFRGCEDDSECGYMGVCDKTRGSCIPNEGTFLRLDAGTSTLTSSTADAGSGG